MQIKTDYLFSLGIAGLTAYEIKLHGNKGFEFGIPAVWVLEKPSSKITQTNKQLLIASVGGIKLTSYKLL